MRKFQRMKTIAAIGLIGSATAFAQPALADEHAVQIGGHVPITCQASLSGNLTETAPGAYKLGDISQFCNTTFSMTVSYPAISSSGASFQFRANSVNAGSQSTLISASLPPTNGSAPIYVQGVTPQEAAALSGGLTFTFLPLGV